MPFQQKSGKRNQMQWFLTSEEKSWLEANKQMPNRRLFLSFNTQFNCSMTYCRMRHFVAQYDLKKMDRGEAYTDAEKQYVREKYETMSDKHIGAELGRTTKSILKLRRSVLKLSRSDQSVKRLRHFRSCSGARNYHARIAKGELQHPSVVLADSFVLGQLKKGTDLEKADIPPELLKLKRISLIMKRELKSGLDNRKNSISHCQLRNDDKAGVGIGIESQKVAIARQDL